MAGIKFLGASGGVTGSGYLLTGNDGGELLIDYGIFQGSEELEKLNFAPLAFDPGRIKAVILTHAHLDHCGRLPVLLPQGYRGQIYMTEPTQKITAVSLADAAAIAQENTDKQPLFTKDDVDRLLDRAQIVAYDQPLTIGEFAINFKNAGHILGSASIEIQFADRKLVFSGDLGNTPEDLIQPTESISAADWVVIESTYGNSVHPEENVQDVLTGEISRIRNTGGVLIIPAFSIERTQEILHLLSHISQNRQLPPDMPVYLDSPMAIQVTAIFKAYPNLYNPELTGDRHPFDFPNLILTKGSEDSKKILDRHGPKIIIAGSGMMSGGRILHHLKNYLSDPATRILIVGFQAPGTLGRELENGVSEVSIYKEILPVHAHITKLESMSSHADQPRLINWLKNIHSVRQVFITHGENPQRQGLSEKIKSDTSVSEITLPLLYETHNLN